MAAFLPDFADGEPPFFRGLLAYSLGRERSPAADPEAKSGDHRDWLFGWDRGAAEARNPVDID